MQGWQRGGGAVVGACCTMQTPAALNRAPPPLAARLQEGDLEAAEAALAPAWAALDAGLHTQDRGATSEFLRQFHAGALARLARRVGGPCMRPAAGLSWGRCCRHSPLVHTGRWLLPAVQPMCTASWPPPGCTCWRSSADTRRLPPACSSCWVRAGLVPCGGGPGACMQLQVGQLPCATTGAHAAGSSSPTAGPPERPPCRRALLPLAARRVVGAPGHQHGASQEVRAGHCTLTDHRLAHRCCCHRGTAC